MRETMESGGEIRMGGNPEPRGVEHELGFWPQGRLSSVPFFLPKFPAVNNLGFTEQSFHALASAMHPSLASPRVHDMLGAVSAETAADDVSRVTCASAAPSDLSASMRMLNLAPHCTIPPKDGADRRAWHLHEGLAPLGIDECFVARSTVVNGDTLTPMPGMESSWRNRKMLAALAALLSGKSYWEFKMLTPAFLREVAGLRPEDFHATIIHFLYSLPLLRQWRGR